MMLLQKYLHDFTRLIFPNLCIGCGEELFTINYPICWKCNNELPRTGFEKSLQNPTASIFYGRLPLQYAFSWLYYNKSSLTQQLVHQIKYKNKTELGRFMGMQMGLAMQEAGLDNQIDALIPLPLNKRKLAKRGYNQATILCEGISEITSIPIHEAAVTRNKFTETQTQKSRAERVANVEEVFELKDFRQLENKHVLLIDDVITTGATIESCGLALLQIAGLQLSVGSLAIASKL